MVLEPLSDKARIEKWGEICVSQNWAMPYELEKWLAAYSIHFSDSGSCFGPSLMSLRASTTEQAEELARKLNGEELATAVLHVLTGIMVFINTEIELAFWKLTIERLNLEWDLVLPPEIVPKRVRDALQYSGE